MNNRVRRRWLWLLFFVSGAPGLMAQMGWTRIVGGGVGHEFPAVLGVVSAWFAGMAAGAAAMARWGGHFRRFDRVYAVLELGCAVWIVATMPLLAPGLAWVRGEVGEVSSLGRELLVGFLVPLLVTGPAAAALGATLPAMERAVAPLDRGGRTVPALYAWNTAGAVVGIGLAVEVVMPALGFRATLLVAAGIQMVCGLVALGLSTIPRVGRVEVEGCEEGGEGGMGRPVGVVEGRGRSGGAISPAGVLFLTGLLGIGFELLGVRALAQTTENTVRTYAVSLGSVLVGTAIGAAWNRRRTVRVGRGEEAVVFGGLALACLGSLWALVGGVMWMGVGRGVSGGLAGEACLAAMVFLVPSVGMGWVYAEWVQRARNACVGVGWAVAWNAFGGALAGPVFVGVLLPALGLKAAMSVAGAGYFLLAPWGGWRGWRWGLPVVGLGCVLALPTGLRLLQLPPGARVVQAWDGRMASVAVIRTADGERALRVNNHFQQGGTATATAARRHAHLPLLLHPEPRRVLFLGVGTGITLGAAADHPDLEVDGIELLPEVVEALRWFEPENRSPVGRPGFTVRVSDARRYVRTASRRYDVIVADLFHPAEDGAGMLYTREHFTALRARLAPGGLVCQWLPLHQLDLDTLRDIGATFLEVFPEASLWLLRFNADLPVVGLMGGVGALKVDPERLAKRMRAEGLVEALRPLALADPVRLLGCRLADADSLRRWMVGGRVATDDLPRVMYEAARSVYRHGSAPHERLGALLGGVEPDFGELLSAGTSEGWVMRLEAFRQARDRHLNGLAKEYSGRRMEAVDDYVASAGLSGDYTGGYAQAVLVASAYARENPALARSILERLEAVRPAQGLARELLERLGR